MDDTQKLLKKRYSKIHPLIFQRSLEKSKNNVELFDILESIPCNYPIMWNDEKRTWEHVDDLIQYNQIKNEKNIEK